MNPFDIRTELLIGPALWGLLTLSVVVMIFTSIKRVKILVEGDEYPTVTWSVKRSTIKRAAALAVVGGLALSSVVITPPGHRAAIYTANGVSTVERGEGYSLIVPIINNANMVDVREQVYKNDAVYTQTKDLLEVTMAIGVNYRILPDQAADIFKAVGQEYAFTIIEPAVLDISKESVGQIEALDFARQREELSQAILAGLQARLGPEGIIVTFVAIEDAIFNKEFVQAVLNKETAEQKAIESERLVQVAVNEAQQIRERAAGDADALVLQATAEQQQQELLGLSPSEYIYYKVWNGILPGVLVSDSAGNLILDLPQAAKPVAPSEETE